ncbi:MAG: acyl-CoA dehydrogenase family protein [Smithella sp.]
MDFNLSEEHRMLRDSVYNFAVKEFGPIAEEMDREDILPDWVFPRMGELGILGITIPEEYGGAGSDLLSAVIAVEQLARVSPSIALSYGAHANLCANNIKNNANEEQKNKYLPPLCTGEHIGAMALTEPGAGSDAVGIQTTAVRDGDFYILNGTKMFITNGPVANTFVLYAKTDKKKGAHGITAFIIEKDFPGFSVSRKLEKVGHRGSPTAELVLEDCCVPVENVEGEVDKGINVMMSGLDIERAFFAGEALGIAEACFDLSVKFAKERVQFGKPIASFQLIQAKLADMYTNIEAARLLTYKAAIEADKAERGGSGTEIHKLAAASILFSAEMATKVALEAVQIYGGYGYMLEYPIQRFFRDAKLLEIGAGTSEIRRLIIAGEILK